MYLQSQTGPVEIVMDGGRRGVSLMRGGQSRHPLRKQAVSTGHGRESSDFSRPNFDAQLRL